MLEIHNISGMERTRNVWYVTDDFGNLRMFFETKDGHRANWSADTETAVIKALGVTCWSEHVDKSIPKYQFVRYAHEGKRND